MILIRFLTVDIKYMGHGTRGTRMYTHAWNSRYTHARLYTQIHTHTHTRAHTHTHTRAHTHTHTPITETCHIYDTFQCIMSHTQMRRYITIPDSNLEGTLGLAV